MLSDALEQALRDGCRTADLGGNARCSEFGARVREQLARSLTGRDAHARADRDEPGLLRMSARPRTLYEKIWDAHVVERRDDGTCLIYIDRHLVHEVTSPQAFEGLRAGRARRCAGPT